MELKKHPYIIKQERKKKLLKSQSSQKKMIKKGRIHKDVINIVEYLVAKASNDNINLKNKKARFRKKEMEKLKKFDPKIINKRNIFKQFHCGTHSSVMKYCDIRSYSDHLISDELQNRVGFLLHKLATEYHKKLLKIKSNNVIEKPFLCGMKECLKKLSNIQNGVKNEKLIGIIMSPQMEPLPQFSGLDKMINEIKDLAKRNNINIIYALNRKQLNYLLNLKPYKGTVSCVTLDL